LLKGTRIFQFYISFLKFVLVLIISPTFAFAYLIYLNFPKLPKLSYVNLSPMFILFPFIPVYYHIFPCIPIYLPIYPLIPLHGPIFPKLLLTLNVSEILSPCAKFQYVEIALQLKNRNTEREKNSFISL
jgi:hypothetical protein